MAGNCYKFLRKLPSAKRGTTMATFTPVGKKIRAQIRRVGQSSISKTCANIKEAKEWATATEAALDAGRKAGVHGQKGLTFGNACTRYLAENPNVSKTAVCIIGNLKTKLGGIMIHKMSSEDIVTYIKNKKFGAPMSGSMHFSFFCSVLNMARLGWKFHVPEFLDEAQERLYILGLIGASRKRERRPTSEELELLYNYRFPTSIPMNDIIRFAVESAMRQSEIMRIEFSTLTVPKTPTEQATVLIKDRKHPTMKLGNNQIVPVLPAALEIINRQERKEGDDRIFPFSSGTIGTYFTMACKQLGIIDLHFHDLRHEAASRLFEKGYQIHQVAMFTGHTNWKTLQRYTHLKAKDIPTIASAPEQTEIQPIEKKEPGTVAIDLKQFAEFKKFLEMKEMMEMIKQTEAA